MSKQISKIIFLASLLFVSSSFAVSAEERNAEWVKEQAFKIASQYAESISCARPMEEKNLIALTPWNNLSDYGELFEAEYALIWYGDIGCDGGTGSINPYIAIIKVGSGNSFFVDPFLSSPAVKFNVPINIIDEIIKHSKNELWLSGKTWGPKDPHCCPSIPAKFFLKRDGKGNWNLVKTIKEKVPITQNCPEKTKMNKNRERP